MTSGDDRQADLLVSDQILDGASVLETEPIRSRTRGRTGRTRDSLEGESGVPQSWDQDPLREAACTNNSSVEDMRGRSRIALAMSARTGSQSLAVRWRIFDDHSER